VFFLVMLRFNFVLTQVLTFTVLFLEMIPSFYDYALTSVIPHADFVLAGNKMGAQVKIGKFMVIPASANW